MESSNRLLKRLLLGCCASLFASATFALPALQLGPTTIPSTDWSYDNGDQTWVFSGDAGAVADLSAYANSDTAGASGSYAWDDAGAASQYAYLVVAAVPDLGDIGDQFDVSVAGASLYDSGYGAPPLADPNSLAPHGIYSSYFEVYRFQFNGPVVNISDTQPPGGGDGDGYKEDFQVSVNSLAAGITGVHFDLFTVSDDGEYTPGQPDDNKLVTAFAPFSHDAEWSPSGEPPAENPNPVPLPATALLVGLALLSLRFTRRKAAL